MNPLVSVITSNYNKGNYIAETLVSLINQSYTNWELILVDDCSTDHSLEVIGKFLDDRRIRFFRNEKNRGGNFSRNLALKETKGDFLIFLDADDLLACGCLEGRVQAAKDFPGHNLLIFSMGVFISKPGDSSSIWIPRSKQPLKDFLQHSLPWSIMQPFWKRELVLQLGGFDESFLRLQDVELNTRALLNKQVKYKQIGGKPDCFYRVDEGRKNYQTGVFLGRWVEAALSYCTKMQGLVPADLKPYLLGTIYQTYFQVAYHFKLKQISRDEFQTFERQLLDYSLVKRSGFLKRKVFDLSKFYNLYFFRIPGFNRLLKAFVVA